MRTQLLGGSVIAVLVLTLLLTGCGGGAAGTDPAGDLGSQLRAGQVTTQSLLTQVNAFKPKVTDNLALMQDKYDALEKSVLKHAEGQGGLSVGSVDPKLVSALNGAKGRLNQLKNIKKLTSIFPQVDKLDSTKAITPAGTAIVREIELILSHLISKTDAGGKAVTVATVVTTHKVGVVGDKAAFTTFKGQVATLSAVTAQAREKGTKVTAIEKMLVVLSTKVAALEKEFSVTQVVTKTDNTGPGNKQSDKTEQKVPEKQDGDGVVKTSVPPTITKSTANTANTEVTPTEAEQRQIFALASQMTGRIRELAELRTAVESHVPKIKDESAIFTLYERGYEDVALAYQDAVHKSKALPIQPNSLLSTRLETLSKEFSEFTFGMIDQKRRESEALTEGFSTLKLNIQAQRNRVLTATMQISSRMTDATFSADTFAIEISERKSILSEYSRLLDRAKVLGVDTHPDIVNQLGDLHSEVKDGGALDQARITKEADFKACKEAFDDFSALSLADMESKWPKRTSFQDNFADSQCDSPAVTKFLAVKNAKACQEQLEQYQAMTFDEQQAKWNGEESTFQNKFPVCKEVGDFERFDAVRLTGVDSLTITTAAQLAAESQKRYENIGELTIAGHLIESEGITGFDQLSSVDTVQFKFAQGVNNGDTFVTLLPKLCPVRQFMGRIKSQRVEIEWEVSVMQSLASTRTWNKFHASMSSTGACK